MRRSTSRSVESSSGFTSHEKESLKRVCLALDKISNCLLRLHPLMDHVELLSGIINKAKRGEYFCDFGFDGKVLSQEAVEKETKKKQKKSLIAMRGVNWEMITRDLNSGYASCFGSDDKEGSLLLPTGVVDEISYEVERQEMELKKDSNSNKKVNTGQRKIRNSKSKIAKLAELNDQPLFPGEWKKTPFPDRVYKEYLYKYKGALCVDEVEKQQLQEQLRTKLNGFQGPAYNYDDHDLTEQWMTSFEDNTGSIGRASVDEVVRTQIENLMENVVGTVQDRVCNENHVVEKPPLGLGPAMIERHVWGIDCHTRRMIELILNEKLGIICIDSATDPESNGTDSFQENEMRANSCRLSSSSMTTLQEIRQMESSIAHNKNVKLFIEKTLLRAINAVPQLQAHKMEEVLKYIISNNSYPQQHKEFAKILLDALPRYGEIGEQFRIHPKGTGVICTAPEGIPPHVVITDYLGEMYPPYRWCEKVEIVQQAQREYNLKPALPEFHNILLERPRKDENGYGLIFVDASQRGNMGSTCSHSCDANCTSAVVARNGELAIVLTTNRYVYPGEELCMDYFSVTSSEVEWRAAICLCGSVACRGSFLHLATQDDLQQVLNQKCGPLYRVASLLRACTDKPKTEKDIQTLKLHGMGKYALGGNSSLWLEKYAADTLRFVEFERQALPCALVRQSLANCAANKSKRGKNKRDREVAGEPNSDEQDAVPPISFSAADMEARSVMEQRLQSLVCCFSMVSKFLASQPHLETEHQGQANASDATPPPMSVLPTSEAIDAVWTVLKSIPKLINRHLILSSSSKKKPTKGKNNEKVNLKNKPIDYSLHSSASMYPLGPEVSQTHSVFVPDIAPNSGDDDSFRCFASSTCSVPSAPLVPMQQPTASVETDHSTRLVEQAVSNIKRILKDDNKPKTISHLRERISEIQSFIVTIQDLSKPTARLVLLGDVLSMWKNTSNFVRVQEFKSVESGPIEVVARDLASTTIDKHRWEKLTRPACHNACTEVDQHPASPQSDAQRVCSNTINSIVDEVVQSFSGNVSVDVPIDSSVSISTVSSVNGVDPSQIEKPSKRSKTASTRKSRNNMVELAPNDVVYTGSKKYSGMFAFWQLVGWFYAGTDQEAVCPDLFGTCMLPTPAHCFGVAEDSYSNKKREMLYEHLSDESSQGMPWPAEIRKCFSTKLQSSDITASTVLGSPVLDTYLGQVDAIEICLDEMFGVERKRKNSVNDETKGQQFDGILPPEENTGWVQCDACMKWRRVPWHVNTDDLPEQWYCKDNFWEAPERRTCEASQDSFNPDKESTVFGDEVAPVECNVGDIKDVFCLRNEVFYEAKVVKLRPATETKPAQVYFHFLGWKKNTDEWIDLGSPRIAPRHSHTDVTARNPRQQEHWQGKKNLVKKSSAKRKAVPGHTLKNKRVKAQ